MLTSKQRAYLRGIANSIDTILMVGKGSITDQVVKQAEDALYAREIIKGKVLENCEINSRQVADILSEKLDCDVVQVIGSKFVLYKKNEDEPKIVLPKNRRK